MLNSFRPSVPWSIATICLLTAATNLLLVPAAHAETRRAAPAASTPAMLRTTTGNAPDPGNPQQAQSTPINPSATPTEEIPVEMPPAPEQPPLVPSLSQTPDPNFRDLRNNNWAFDSVRSLVGRYGCLSGYPDGTFRGQQVMTRYEFAAGMNACLERMNQLLTDRTSNLVTREELSALFRLLSTIFGNVEENASPAPEATPQTTPGAPQREGFPAPAPRQ